MNPPETESACAAAKPSRTPAPAHPLVLNAAVICQDAPCREPALALCQRVTRSIGRQSFYFRVWNFRDLSEPEVFQEAVLAAVDADVVIVSIRAAETLPARFCGWLDSWVPRRQRQDGTLIALVDVTGQPGAASEHTRSYLRNAAQQARLEFLPREHAAASLPVYSREI